MSLSGFYSIPNTFSCSFSQDPTQIEHPLWKTSFISLDLSGVPPFQVWGETCTKLYFMFSTCIRPNLTFEWHFYYHISASQSFTQGFITLCWKMQNTLRKPVMGQSFLTEREKSVKNWLGSYSLGSFEGGESSVVNFCITWPHDSACLLEDD